MTATTIKVDATLRDRLKAQASQHGRTLGEHLSALADQEERLDRIATLRAQMARTSPEDWASYERETRAWGSVEAWQASS